MSAASWAETRRKVERVAEHCESCQQCRRALIDSPLGEFPMCLEGDGLVADVYRDVYARHMAAVRARKERSESAPHRLRQR